jgi:hydrogenase expression/formation protein HypC
MCLGVPGLVTEVDEFTAVVDFWGVRRRVRLDLVDEPVVPGDYVLNHVGFAIRRIPAEDVQTTLRLYEELVKQNTGATPSDLMAADVKSEIEAGEAATIGAARSAGETFDQRSGKDSGDSRRDGS